MWRRSSPHPMAPWVYVGASSAAVAVAPPYRPFATLPLGPGQAQPSWAALFVPPEPLDEPKLRIFTETLTQLSSLFLQANPQFPRLYDSGVRYQAWPQTEFWLTPDWAMAFRYAGHGVDCKTLAAWRCAELRVRDGDPGAKCVFQRYDAGPSVVYHVRVQRSDGSVEDPSVLLGMDDPIPQNRPALRLIQGGLR